MNTKRAGRPPKNDAERKDSELRIRLTADQKEVIARASTLAGQDMAAWARLILLQAAREATK